MHITTWSVLLFKATTEFYKCSENLELTILVLIVNLPKT